MKNIQPNYDPSQATKLSVKDLQLKLQQLKQTQPPTVALTDIGSVVSTIQALTPTVVTHRHSIIATLTPPNNNPVLMAYPEWSFYNALGLSNSDGHWPDGAFWKRAGNRQYQNVLDLNTWFSWGETDNHNLVALLDMARNDYGTHPTVGVDGNSDGSTPLDMGFYVFLRWRFLVPGTNS